ncbi:MAG: lipoyl synthase, partial [Bacteriovoracaceae bacterium]
ETMGLKYVVITSVDRDDLADGGASHFANVVKRIRNDHPETKVEVLIPDFDARPENMKVLGDSDPFVIAQNIETVKRLTHIVRDKRAGYQKTLDCLKFYKENFSHITTKSSIQVGFGEDIEEIKQCMQDLRAVEVGILTIGQYLRPTPSHLKVEKYYHPDEFEQLKEMAYELGFEFVASGPLVRSSYKAADFLEHLRSKGVEV